MKLSLNKCVVLLAAFNLGCSSFGAIQLGPRPFYLIDKVKNPTLKKVLESCEAKPQTARNFSIAHRGAPLQFPEHTRESYLAAIKMGAGVLECDVTFTKDLELVCRHDQCDLHQTTNILAVPELAAKCSEGFTPYDPQTGQVANAKCCTSDITLKEFKSLCGKMDGFNPKASNVAAFMNGTQGFRTDLYSQCGTLLSHIESIALFKEHGVKMTPELKTPEVKMPFNGEFSQSMYAKKMIQEYRDMQVKPEYLFPQSFLLSDLKQWISEEGSYGEQSVFLDGRYEISSFDHKVAETWAPSMKELKDLGLKYLAPPMWMLLKLNSEGAIGSSLYARAAKENGLGLITWSLERSGNLKDGGGWYYQTVSDAINSDGDIYGVLNVLHEQVGIDAIFSDWPATVSYYANCMDLD